jgi:hypothetical protein
MGCGCSGHRYGDTGRITSDIAWSGPQMGNRGHRPGPRRPTLDELDEPKEVLRSEVIELLSLREVQVDGRASTTQAFPFPPFETESVDSAVLSVVVSQKQGFDTAARSLWVRIQNAVRTSDDPSVTFVGDGASAEIDLGSPSLMTIAWPVVGPGARLLLEWEQGTTESSASVTLAVWLTLRRKGTGSAGR